MQVRWFGVAVLVSLCGGLTWLLGAHPAAEVRVPREVVQEAVDRMLPVRGERGGVSFRLEAAAVALGPDGRVRLDARAVGDSAGREVSGGILGTAAFVLRDGRVRLADFAVEADSLAVAETARPDRRSAAVGRVLALVGAEAAPVPPPTVRETVERVRDGASLALREAFERRAVAEADGADGLLGRAAIRGARTEGGAAVLTVDPLTPLVRGVGWAAAGAFGLMAALSVLLGTVAVGQRLRRLVRRVGS